MPEVLRHFKEERTEIPSAGPRPLIGQPSVWLPRRAPVEGPLPRFSSKPVMLEVVWGSTVLQLSKGFRERFNDTLLAFAATPQKRLQ